MLPGPEDALRDAVVRLGVPVHELPRLARYGSVEALSVQGLAPDQAELLARAVRAGDGDVLCSADGSRAVLLMPLLTAGSLATALAEGGAEARALAGAIAAVLVARGAPPAPLLLVRGHRLDFGAGTLVMGIVNVTPDSFSGDGVGSDVGAAVARARMLVAEGADVIDIGGESTRPNSVPVPADEELARVLPVLRALVSERMVVSIDTRKAVVARAALAEGAAIVNDVWGLRGDPAMAAVVAAVTDAGLVVMHNQQGVAYGDLLGDICSSLRESLVIAAAAGISLERVIVDPGFGFAKTPAHNLELMRRLGELRGLGRAVMLGPSRKSTIAALTWDAPPDMRLEGSVALAVLAAAAGAHIVRVHDVAATVRALRVADAVVRGTPADVLSLPMPGRTG